MTVTINADCTAITFTTTNLSGSANITALEVTSSKNCSTSTVVNITSQINTISNNSITLTAAQMLNNSTITKFCDGVYYLQLKITKFLENTTFEYTESECFLVNCNLKCKMIDVYLSDKTNTKVIYLYDALVYGTSCDECDCSAMCTIYNELLNQIGTNDSTDCGCG